MEKKTKKVDFWNPKSKTKSVLVRNKSYKKKEKNIQDEMEKDTEKLFKKIDKLFEGYFGKMCPDFNPNCIQCKVNLVYNQFKSNIWENFIRR